MASRIRLGRWLRVQMWLWRACNWLRARLAPHQVLGEGAPIEPSPLLRSPADDADLRDSLAPTRIFQSPLAEPTPSHTRLATARARAPRFPPYADPSSRVTRRRHPADEAAPTRIFAPVVTREADDAPTCIVAPTDAGEDAPTRMLARTDAGEDERTRIFAPARARAAGRRR